MLLALTVVTGLVDSFSYLVLGHVFVANMTGNVVFLAFALVGAKGSRLASLVRPGRLRPRGARQRAPLVHLGPRRGRILALSTACEVALVASAMVVGWTATFPGRAPCATCWSSCWPWRPACRTARPASWPCPT